MAAQQDTTKIKESGHAVTKRGEVSQSRSPSQPE